MGTLDDWSKWLEAKADELNAKADRIEAEGIGFRMTDTPAPVELSAQARTISTNLGDLLQGYMAAGLTRAEAVDLLREVIITDMEINGKREN